MRHKNKDDDKEKKADLQHDKSVTYGRDDMGAPTSPIHHFRVFDLFASQLE